MKVIVITGSYGKTTVAKIFFDYFKKVKYKTKIYELEAILKLDDSRNIKDHLDKDRLEGVQVAIIHISFKHIGLLESIGCEVLLITNYHLRKSTDNILLSDMNVILNKYANNCNQIIINSNCINQIHLIDKNIKTFSIDDTANYELKIISDAIEGLKIKYRNKILKTTLMTRLHAENIICAIAALESMELFNMRKFQKVIRNVCIEGQIQNIKFGKRKTIIVDKRSYNFRDLTDAIVQTTKSFNYKLMIMMNESVHHSLELWIESLDVLEFKKSKYCYIMRDKASFAHDDQLLLKTLVQKGVYLVECLDNSKDGIKKIYKSIKKNEILIILAQEKISKIIKDMEN